LLFPFVCCICHSKPVSRRPCVQLILCNFKYIVTCISD
jgi:hypothetical protein